MTEEGKVLLEKPLEGAKEIKTLNKSFRTHIRYRLFLKKVKTLKTTIKTEQKKALNPLKTQLKNETPYVRKVTAQAIGETFKGTGSSEALALLKPLLKDEDWEMREAAVRAIKELFKSTGSSEALDELKPLLKDEDHVVRGGSCRGY
ncbi:MAG: HEAT repeat domain-containing protein [Candidatus Wukongarchaeota archaeon]|nr:HEAT repeat domain-containing protein [Candidatus Wukongarchaeota archaeon]